MTLGDNVLILKEKINMSLDNKEENELALEYVKKALINANCMALETSEDFFKFFASLNLLNAYVKKPYAVDGIKKAYNFKKEVRRGIESIIMWKPNGITWSHNEQNNATIVSIEGMQFSFHGIDITDEMKIANQNQAPIEWEGLRLQPNADMVLEYANELENLSDKTIVDANLSQLYNELDINAFNEEAVKISM